MSCLLLKEMEAKEVEKISILVKTVFEEFVAPNFSDEGINNFLAYISPEAILHRENEGKNFLIIAKEAEQIVGIIEMRDYYHICLFFVDKNNHNNGIAKKLLAMAIKKCKEVKPDLDKIEVNSSRYGVPIYQKLGFTQIGEEQVINGILFIPMKASM